MIQKQKPKTGEFHVRVGVGPEAFEGEKVHVRRRLLDQMARRVGDVTMDNREYELVARVGEWEPAYPPFVGERLQVDFTLVLLDALTAEVGEWVKELPVKVPEESRRCRLGEGFFGEAAGRVFERGRPGWQRTE